MKARGGQLCRGEVSFPKAGQVKVRRRGRWGYGAWQEHLCPSEQEFALTFRCKEACAFQQRNYQLRHHSGSWLRSYLSFPVLTKETSTVRPRGAFSHHITQATAFVNRCEVRGASAPHSCTSHRQELACTTRSRGATRVAWSAFFQKDLLT